MFSSQQNLYRAKPQTLMPQPLSSSRHARGRAPSASGDGCDGLACPFPGLFGLGFWFRVQGLGFRTLTSHIHIQIVMTDSAFCMESQYTSSFRGAKCPVSAGHLEQPPFPSFPRFRVQGSFGRALWFFRLHVSWFSGVNWSLLCSRLFPSYLVRTSPQGYSEGRLCSGLKT